MIKDYQILKESLINTMQNSGLDIGAAYFILKDVFISFENLYYTQINKECLEEAKEINAEAKEHNTDNKK